MKFPSVPDKLIAPRKVLGLEVVFAGEQTLLNAVWLEKKNKELIIADSKSGISLDAFLEKADPSVPLALVFDGRGVIHKKIALHESDDLRSVLNKILPNTQPEDFYVQHTDPFNGTAIASACRKASIDEVLDKLRLKKLDILTVNLGPLASKYLLPLLEHTAYNHELLVGKYNLQFTDGFVSDFSLSAVSGTESLTIGKDRLLPAQILPFAAAFQALVAGLGTLTSNTGEAELKENYRQKRLYKTYLIGGIAFLFFLVFINYFLFDYYSSKREKMELDQNINDSSLKQIDTLKKQIAEKKEILERTGMLQTSETSYYADRIAAGIPTAIRLTQLEVYPAEKKQEEEDGRFAFLPGIIWVKGQCKYSIEANDWINLVRSYEWVKDVKLIHYNQTSSEKIGEFFVQIEIK